MGRVEVAPCQNKDLIQIYKLVIICLYHKLCLLTKL